VIVEIASVLFWLAALHRIYLAVRSPRLWSVAFALAVTALAIALAASVHGAWLDGLAPHLSTLLARVAAAGAACAALIYVQTLRQEKPSRKTLTSNVVSGVVAVVLLAATWAKAPLHRGGDLFGRSGVDLFADLHNLVYYLYVAYGAGAAAAYCGRRLVQRPGRRDEAARVPSLILIGAGAGLASCALLLGAGSIFVRSEQPETALFEAKDAVISVASGVLSAGVLLLLAANPVVVEFVALYRRWLRLRSLWKALTAMHPAVALRTRPTWPPRQALRFREQRALVEIHDALARESVPSDVTTIQALGRALRRGERGPVPASSVLPASGDFTADLDTVLQLASAYDTAPR
jgi:hypothetical protein